MKFSRKLPVLPIAMTAFAVLNPAFADDMDQVDPNDSVEHRNMAGDVQANADDEQQDVTELLNDAKAAIEKMKDDEGMPEALSKAKGIYVVPDYGRGALIGGVRGGQGVALTQKNGQWDNPAFYNMGAISIGAQAGVEAGEIAFLLMTDNAVDTFKQNNNFSLNADAGLTIVDWSAQAQGSFGKGDIILWSDTEGAFAGGAVSFSDISADEDANRTYYGKPVEVTEILEGKVSPK